MNDAGQVLLYKALNRVDCLQLLNYAYIGILSVYVACFIGILAYIFKKKNKSVEYFIYIIIW